MTAESIKIRGLPRGIRRIARRENASLLIALVLLAAIFLVAILVPVLGLQSPTEQNLRASLEPPSLQHLMGTDHLGRDIFARVMHGFRVDLQVGLICTIVPGIIGTVIGLLAGYYGGLIDAVSMRLLDVVVAFPFLVLIVAIVAILGSGLVNMYIAMTLVGWVSYARIVRGEVMVAKNLEYVLASKALGYSDARIILRHVLPNVISPAIVFTAADVVLCILTGASLGFLGLGAQPPTAEWGVMIADGRPYITSAWWLPTFPGLALVVTGVVFSLFGDGLADVLRVGR